MILIIYYKEERGLKFIISMAKEFITEDDVSTSYITSSEVYELIGGVNPDYNTIGSNGYITFPAE